MKLAEALLQDKPIKRKGFSQWCKPEIVESNVSPFAALPTVCGRDKYTLDYTNMTADDWEVKQEPMKFEFDCSWVLDSKSGSIYPLTSTSGSGLLLKMYDSGKRFRVTCEEIVE